MICERCKADGKTSRVVEGYRSKTLVGWVRYYDEAGTYHSDDPNITTTRYACSNGHSWEVLTNAHGGFVGETSAK